MRRNMIKMMARDISRNVLQYLSMIAITMLAVTLFCGFVSNTLTLEQKVENYYAESNLMDLTAQFSSAAQDAENYFSALKDSGEVSGFEFRFYAESSMGQHGGKLYAGKNTISAPIIAEGSAGVLLDIYTKDWLDYEIGQTIEVELPGYPAMHFKISGFMYFAEVSTHSDYSLYLDEDVFCGEIFAKTGFPVTPQLLYNQVLVKTDNPSPVKESVNSFFSTQENNRLMFVFDRNTIESVAALSGEVKTSLQMIYVFPVIFLLVSILVVNTTISALILRERTNIGTFKGLGFENKKIALYYSCFGSVLCLIGGVVGALLGPYIVPNVVGIKYSLVYTIPPLAGNVFSLLWSAVAIFTVCFIALLIGLLVCKSVIKEKPAECMRPAIPKSSFLSRKNISKADVESAAEKTEETFRKGTLPLKMALRNILIKPSRAVMTVVGVMGCTALLVCGFGIGDTMNRTVDLELGEQFSYDIVLSCSTSASGGVLSFMEQLKAGGTIAGYETYSTFLMTVKNGDYAKVVKIYKLEKDSGFTTINPAEGAFISKAVADEMDVKVGSIVELSGGANTYRVEITKIIETALTKGIFISSDLLEGNYHSVGMWVRADVTEELMARIKSTEGVQDAVSMDERREMVTEAVSAIDMIKLTMMIFSIALSVVVLYNLSLLNIKERNRSIATLKVLGFSNLEVSGSLFYEIMLLVFLGTGLGLLLGYPIMYLVLSINKIELVAFIYCIKPLTYAVSSLLSLLVAAGINLLFGARMKKIHMIDSLKSVE